jgi:hypothetical protein
MALPQELSDLIFEIKEKITDQEYKKLMELGAEIFKKHQCKFYEITHLDPRLEYRAYDADDTDEEDDEYYRLTLTPQKTILEIGEAYTEKTLTEYVPTQLEKHGYCELDRPDNTHDLLNKTMDDEIRTPYYHVIAIKPLGNSHIS